MNYLKQYFVVKLLLFILLTFLDKVVGNPGLEMYGREYNFTNAVQPRTYTSYPQSQNNLYPTLPPPVNGKCFVEVLTVTIAKNKFNPPAGNGSVPELSIIEKCCDGYQPYKYNKKICVPVCQSGCRNGVCKAPPNQCECLPSYVLSLDGTCVETCPIGCINGHCHINGTCFCNTGYFHEPQKKYCVPYCQGGCPENSNCTAPGLCTCIKGFKMNYSTRVCEPSCEPPCGSGQCYAPNQCACYYGFFLKDGTCQTTCSKGCFRGRCVANEVCVCDPGWKLDIYGNACDPVCTGGCDGGICTGPEICTCAEGYKKIGRSCKPVCKSGCKHGDCVAPNKCVCKYGYKLDSTGSNCKRKHSSLGHAIVGAIKSAGSK